MDLKNSIYTHIENLLSEKISAITEALGLARESRDSDTKSSAGDKHETSRALAQIEIDKLEVQLNKTLILEKELQSINLHKKYDQVEMGCLVITNQENYFISIGMGKVEVEGRIFYAISVHSPIGEMLKLKQVGEKVRFNGREIVVKEIL